MIIYTTCSSTNGSQFYKDSFYKDSFDKGNILNSTYKPSLEQIMFFIKDGNYDKAVVNQGIDCQLGNIAQNSLIRANSIIQLNCTLKTKGNFTSEYYNNKSYKASYYSEIKKFLDDLEVTNSCERKERIGETNSKHHLEYNRPDGSFVDNNSSSGLQETKAILKDLGFPDSIQYENRTFFLKGIGIDITEDFILTDFLNQKLSNVQSGQKVKGHIRNPHIQIKYFDTDHKYLRIVKNGNLDDYPEYDSLCINLHIVPSNNTGYIGMKDQMKLIADQFKYIFNDDDNVQLKLNGCNDYLFDHFSNLRSEFERFYNIAFETEWNNLNDLQQACSFNSRKVKDINKIKFDDGSELEFTDCNLHHQKATIPDCIFQEIKDEGFGAYISRIDPNYVKEESSETDIVSIIDDGNRSLNSNDTMGNSSDDFAGDL